jgi:lipopolysaccharide export system ATP-binding protein
MGILKATNLKKSYKGRAAVRDVSLHLNSGEVVGLLGPNGAGKTTTFYQIVGLVAPEEGSIFLDDSDITDLPLYLRARLGLAYLPQEPSVFRKLSVEDNILAILETLPGVTKQQRSDKLEELLDELGIGHVRKTLAAALSGGERRRVEIARALARSPKFMLLDEPFAGIDPIAISDIQKIIKQLSQKNIGILITDHNVRETLGTCHRAYIMVDGKVLEDGSPEDISKSEKARRYYLGENFAL